MSIRDVFYRDITALHQATTVHAALQRMVEGGFNSCVVLDDDDKLVGVLATQDIAAATVPSELQQNINLAQSMVKPGFFTERCREVAVMQVKDVMRVQHVSVKPDADAMEIAADFLHNDLYMVPVVDDNGRVLGIVTRTEIKQALAAGMGITEK